MTVTDVLVQTRLPPAVAKWLKNRADQDGDSVAGVLRRLAVGEALRATVPCWIMPENQSDPQVILGRGTLPHYHLRLLDQIIGGDARFQVTTTNGHRVSGDVWRSTGYFATLDQRRFILSGDHRPWRLVTSWENIQTKCMEVTLRPEDRRVVTAIKVKDEAGGGGLVGVVYSDGEVRYGIVDRPHGTYHYPVEGKPTFLRDGWPTASPELVISAMRAAAPA